MKRVYELFLKLENDRDKVIDSIMSKFNSVDNGRDEYEDFFDNIIDRINKGVKDNNNIVYSLSINPFSKDYTVYTEYIIPGEIHYYAIEYTDWDCILGSYFVTDASFIDTLASIIYFMTLIEFDEEKRKNIIKIIGGK